jgi:hypothetical protein
MARVRRSASEWVALIDRWRDSGLSLPEFCERNGLNFGTMSGWAYKQTHKGALERARGEADANTSPAAAFVPIRVIETEPPPRSSDRSGIEIVVGAGRRVVVGAGFDAKTLRRVVAVLEDRTC